MENYHWYAVYTRPNAEKKLVERLSERGQEAYLPLTAVTKQWSDRKKTVFEPLFKSYVFVRSTLEGLHRVKNSPGFAHFVRFGGYPVTMPERQIIRIKTVMKHFEATTSIANQFIRGSTVTIINGPLMGMIGVLTEIKGKQKVAVEVSDLGQSMLVTLPIESLVIGKPVIENPVIENPIVKNLVKVEVEG